MELNQETIKKLRGLILFTVIVVVAGINYRRLLEVAAALFHMAWPFILGAAIAFILNVPMRNIERHLVMFRRAYLQIVLKHIYIREPGLSSFWWTRTAISIFWR